MDRDLLPVSESQLKILRRKLIGFFSRRVSDALWVEDLTQEVLLRWTRYRQTVTLEHPEPWIFRVAKALLVDWYRAQSREKKGKVSLDLAEEREFQAAEGNLPHFAVGLAKCLGPLFDRLPEPFGGAIRNTLLLKEPQARLAAERGVSVNTVKTWVARGKARLLASLEACCTLERDHSGRLMGFFPRAGGCSEGFGCGDQSDIPGSQNCKSNFPW